MMEALTDLVGTERGTSCWFETKQADVDAHAETVGDGGWIHNDVERSAAGPYGGTLLQGSLMLAVGKIDKKSLKADATALLEG